MAKYGFSTAIPYGTDIFEVTGVEYCEWEDALEKCNGDSLAMEWATYDVLINNGYLVSQPTEERPAPEAPETTKRGKKKAAGQTTKSRTQAGDSSPGFRDIPDGFNVIDGRSREPVWTQSRILSERDKLLKERERIHALKEQALEHKIIKQQIYERVKAQEEAKSKTAPLDWAYIAGGVVVTLFIFMIAFYEMSKGR